MLDVTAVLRGFCECGNRRASDEEGEVRVARGRDCRDWNAAHSTGEDGEGRLSGKTEARIAGFVDRDGGAG